MLQSAAIFALLMAAGVYFASAKHAICLRRLLLGTAVVCLFGGSVLFFAPRDYLIQNPWAAPVFHPWAVGLWCSLAFVGFCSLSSGLLARCVVDGFRRKRRGR